MLNDANRDAIAEAVATAEAATSGEIVCVLARRVSLYGETPLLWAAAIALLAPPLVLALGLDLFGAGAWTAAHSSALAPSPRAQITGYALIQLALFAVVAAVVAAPGLRTALTPRFVKAHRVRQAALAQLAAAGLAAGPSRAAVVIFAADDEHRVEVLASEAAHAAIGQAVWDQAVAAVLAGMKRRDPTSGFVAAVALCGEALAAHFPQDAPDANAIVNRPLEL